MSFLILVVKKIDNQTNKIVFKYIFNNKKIIKRKALKKIYRQFLKKYKTKTKKIVQQNILNHQIL